MVVLVFDTVVVRMGGILVFLSLLLDPEIIVSDRDVLLDFLFNLFQLLGIHCNFIGSFFRLLLNLAYIRLI